MDDVSFDLLSSVVPGREGRFKATDAGRLRAEYNRLVEGLALRGDFPAADGCLASPALPDDILKEAVPGNIRKAEHFMQVLHRLVQYIEGRLETENVEKENPTPMSSFISKQYVILSHLWANMLVVFPL
ncbi:hypothetical protein TSUD_58970 [Trifolium subterraneum]|uniref:DNA 5'-3' helicase n=1 Tax=Trifolium subterraneum TaxID=3900 RepID=A0A2Z6MBE1_TRISU|nr:hypothetical protein TSUD_58970 [Trifolium subterraneum]